ncbi:hypothetical protein [Flexivirga alba]|uniref:DUF2188 domain-containing protein n=1 Tax=Flexivirga alba TaxID=702742 RepID=A0ABW2AJ75_9MICO
MVYRYEISGPAREGEFLGEFSTAEEACKVLVGHVDDPEFTARVDQAAGGPVEHDGRTYTVVQV